MTPVPLKTWLDGAPPPGGDASGETVVVIDVLRATSTIATALANGARYVAFAADVEGAFALKRALEAAGDWPILGGERDGVKLPGFDAGNSPREYDAARVTGRPVVLCTTNGTAALERCRRARRLFAACFLNASAVVNRVVRAAEAVTLCCSGKFGAPSLEDICCAGLLAEKLMAAQPYDADDATLVAAQCWRAQRKDVGAMLRNASHGRYLVGLGFDEDLIFCARVDALAVVASRNDDGNLSNLGGE